ncbi:MAG: DALR anticodon-binding domain-containing protein, partial [Patescibacteria group bacterium]
KIQSLEQKSQKEKAEFLGKAYAEGAKAYENENFKKEIDELNKKIYEKDKSIWDLYEKGKKWSLDYFDSMYKKLGTKFDKLYFESEAGEQGLKIVKDNTPKVFKEDQGAIIFKGDDFGLHTRVFINSQGLPTYEAKELGLAPLKYKDFKYDLSIIITGNEINEYFKVLLKALSLINQDLAEKTVHLSHGMVRLESGKMSSRTGDVIKAEDLLNDIESKINKQFDSVENIEQIAVGAAKYALLKSGIGKDIVFDIEESISLNGNSGPYIQYTYARTQSVLAKSPAFAKASAGKQKLNFENLEKEEREVLRQLAYFQDFAEIASKNYSPNTICTYLFELAQNFNLFYEKHKIIGSENEEFRLVLTSATGKILKKGLNLLGIASPERM